MCLSCIAEQESSAINLQYFKRGRHQCSIKCICSKMQSSQALQVLQATAACNFKIEVLRRASSSASCILVEPVNFFHAFLYHADTLTLSLITFQQEQRWQGSDARWKSQAHTKAESPSWGGWGSTDVPQHKSVKPLEHCRSCQLHRKLDLMKGSLSSLRWYQFQLQSFQTAWQNMPSGQICIYKKALRAGESKACQRIYWHICEYGVVRI